MKFGVLESQLDVLSIDCVNCSGTMLTDVWQRHELGTLILKSQIRPLSSLVSSDPLSINLRPKVSSGYFLRIE